MLPQEIIKKIRLIDIKTRLLVNEMFSGEYHSIFKGRGIEFSEVREYSYGDDIRTIDWNVTARFGKPYVKVYEEGMPPHPLKVAFATVGARLIDGHKDDGSTLKLKAGKIRGIRSEGMVCSEKELGLSDEHEGILFLPQDAPVGTPLVDYMEELDAALAQLEARLKRPFGGGD